VNILVILQIAGSRTAVASNSLGLSGALAVSEVRREKERNLVILQKDTKYNLHYPCPEPLYPP
jgi:hypothetical protein